MKKLDFNLPEFTRVVWASPEIHQIWGPRVARINQVWPLIERMTVAQGMRPGALQSVHPGDLVDFQGYCLSNDIPFVILGRERTPENYGNASSSFEDGKPWTYRTYMGDSSGFFLEDWKNQNNLEIAKSLGYPSCCAKSFDKLWRIEGWRDLTPFMGSEGSYLCNILLRYIGVRAVFHLPCSFSCPETQRIAQDIFRRGHECGFQEEVNWIHDMLRWPITWSSLHGVATIETPYVKIVTATDALADKEFRALNQGIHMKTLIDTWTDNGFKSLEGMNLAHNFILDVIREVKPFAGRVLDLGCGNGLLLDRIITEYPSLIASGVEENVFKYQRAKSKFSDEHSEFFQGSIEKIPWQERDNTLILLSLNRVYESKDPEALLLKLVKSSVFTLLYSYEGWNHQHDNLIIKHFKIVSSRSNLSNKLEAKLMVPA